MWHLKRGYRNWRKIIISNMEQKCFAFLLRASDIHVQLVRKKWQKWKGRISFLVKIIPFTKSSRVRFILKLTEMRKGIIIAFLPQKIVQVSTPDFSNIWSFYWFSFQNMSIIFSTYEFVMYNWTLPVFNLQHAHEYLSVWSELNLQTCPWLTPYCWAVLETVLLYCT